MARLCSGGCMKKNPGPSISDARSPVASKLRFGKEQMDRGNGRDSCCGPAGSVLTQERAALIQQAFHLEWLTVAWMIVEGAVAIGAGVVAASLTLTAFGLDSLIELASACV